MAFNPMQQQEVRILLAKQELMPEGFKGLRFELQQPDRPLRPQEEMPIRLVVTAAADAPITQVPHEDVKVPPTAGGTAAPPLSERTGTDAVSVAVRPGNRIHLTASGEVDVDGSGPLPAADPNGTDASGGGGDRRRFLLSAQSPSAYAGALIGSFDNFRSSFVVGTEATITVPEGTERLMLAVNDFDGGYGENTGAGFAVEVATLDSSPVTGEVIQRAAAPAVTMPQINIAAASGARVTLDQFTYNLVSNHGGVTYQFLVISDEGHAATEGRGKSIYIILLILGILLLLFLLIWFFRRRPAH
jgi:hypothetical protein